MTSTCPRCTESERQWRLAKASFNRQMMQMKSEIELLRRQRSEQSVTIESLRKTLDDRNSMEINALLTVKDHEITYLKRKLDEHLGQIQDEKEAEPEGTRFGLLEID
jgi:hypothetical protein